MGFEEKSRLNHAKYTVDDLERPRSSFFGDSNFGLAGLDPNLLPKELTMARIQCILKNGKAAFVK